MMCNKSELLPFEFMHNDKVLAYWQAKMNTHYADAEDRILTTNSLKGGRSQFVRFCLKNIIAYLNNFCA